MAIDRDRLLQTIAVARKPLGLAEVLSRMGLNPGARTELKRSLRELVRAGEVARDGKRYSIPGVAQPQPNGGGAPEREPVFEAQATTAPALIGSRAGKRGRFVVGTLKRHPDGFGFVRPLSGGSKGTDLFLPADEARRAMDGDLVRVEVVTGFRGRPAARLIDVVERRRTRAVGTYIARGKTSYVIPADPALGEAIAVPPSQVAEDGDLVKLQITQGPTARNPAAGEVLEVLGEHGDPKAEVLESAYRQGFSDAFPDDVVEEAGAVEQRPDPNEIARRRDLRALRLITIDGEDARDFDDAVYVERTRSGYRLVVAIADVAHYVRPNRPLDHEALRRGTSVYFPGFAIPMLPERLSNGICSLKPEEDRLCMVADLIVEPAGTGAKVASAELYEGVMKSAARCTYTEVAAVLGGERVPHREFLKGDFKLMEELAMRFLRTREERGSIDFDLPEVKVVLDAQGRPERLEKRERNIAHRIIEEFMLAANEAVARYFSQRDLPTVYRVHGEPDEEKLEIFLALARAHGFAAETGEEITGKALNALLKQIAGSPEQRTLNFLLLRSMMQAVYSSENVGHFGLAAPFYLHFTSPIRRYPDLMVHRLLKGHWARAGRELEDEARERLDQSLDAISARSSERERAAMSSERDVHSFFAALFLKDKVGEEFDGTISAVTEFGFFVELTGVYVEGLVKSETVGEGGEFDADRHRMVFADGRQFRLGDPVRIRVASVNLARRHIDFDLLGGPARGPVQRKGPRNEAGPKRRAPEREPERGRGGPKRRGGGPKQHKRRRR